MMTLSTAYLGLRDQHQVVGFCTGRRRRGVVLVSPAESGTVSPRYAELKAIQYLLKIYQVFNRPFERSDTYLLQITASLQDGLLNLSNSRDLKHLSHFIHQIADVRVVGCEQPYRSIPAIEELDRPGQLEILEVLPDNTPMPILAESVIGSIAITQHAVDQFVERYHSDKLFNESSIPPFVLLKRRLESNSLKVERLPPDVERHKFAKYSGNETLKVLNNPGSQLHYVTVMDPNLGHRVCVTVYRRHPKYTDSTHQLPTA